MGYITVARYIRVRGKAGVFIVTICVSVSLKSHVVSKDSG
jgi:hypothetical protein